MFRFRLQRILELREQHEQAKARELASARDAADRAAEARLSLQTLRSDSEAQLHAARGNGPRIGHLTQLGTVLTALDERLVVAGDAVKEADAEVRQAQELLEEAARDRRVLDRLKSRHADAWRSDEAQRDRTLMDEVALMQFARKQDQSAPRSADSTENVPPRDGSTR
ncbi:MAG TPA: flagellar export protein FliJ [Gemmatimonas aurantiaca]|uniref:Flagellar FliJ protein n=2 Tax=Gemmatimonas aurantiaca TaxID=173480 RepID=C1A559_GEMAT|nr:flagellar export protein FliJ [Gemmatimonas aurantiaca]BAH37369.1 putative flagellar FliJ protein [Gemmatimonas aurantiaca T-27]HCT55785.1 flagellar export protein FliJ [Gemmatimonas aurantiaca]